MNIQSIKVIPIITSAILLFLCSKSSQGLVLADGTLIKGTRVINVVEGKLDTINVYRDDAVELCFVKKAQTQMYSIPLIKGATQVEKDSVSSMKFTAHDTGSFPVYSTNKKQVALISVVEFITESGKLIQNLTAKEVAAALKDTSILILDVRPPADFLEGHLPRATSFPFNDLADKISNISDYKNRPLLVYCRTGNRSINAIQILSKHGFDNILYLRGGIQSWSGEGFELAK
jgi:rhodanese-related sulfurtransferase